MRKNKEYKFISRNGQRQWKRDTGFVIFETIIIVAVIAVLAYLQTKTFETSSDSNIDWLQIVLIALQILVSGYAGHKIFPKIFRNEELISFQEIMLGRIITILKSENRDILSFELRELVSQTVGNIDQKVTTHFMNKQDENIRSFFNAAEGSFVINPSKMEKHIQVTIQADQPKHLPGKATDKS